MIPTKLRNLRIGTLFVGLCLGYAAIGVKLYFIQIKHRDFFTSLGQQQYVTSITKTPDRALIYDRNGEPLAINKEYLSAFITPNNLKDRRQTEQFLKQYFPDAARRLKEQRHAAFMYVQRRLTPEQHELINNAHISDLYILSEAGRFYPVPSAGTLVGMTNIDNEGICGIELLYDAQLRGKATRYALKRDARNARHYYFEKELSQAGHPGKPLHLTLDGTLQFLAHEALQETVKKFEALEGAVIIMDPQTGDILAATNYPDFDPQNTQHLDPSCTKPKVFTDTYEFGSVIKVFLGLAALDENVVTPDTIFNCHNTKHIILEGMRINTVKAHGMLTFSELIQHSNNIGTAQIALLLKEKLYDHYRRCGFGTATGIQMGEQAGHVTHPSTWSRQSLASLSYGYEIRATLLQLACAFCMIARHGVSIKPRLMKDDTPPHMGQQRYRPEVIKTLQDILEKTTTSGTAQKAAIKGYRVLGKTGTANVLDHGVYHSDRNLYTFTGIIEKGSYQRVIVTFIKEARAKDLYASTVAAPLFERIAEQMLIHEGIISHSPYRRTIHAP